MASRSEPNEIRITRVYDAPVRLVWEAWTNPVEAAKWWGPRGFTTTTHSKDLRPGGTWRYTMHGPDGVDYPNIATYHVVEPLAKLVYDHGATETTPPLFRVTVTFSEHDGKTTMDMIMALPTPEAAKQTAGFVKKAGGNATWDRLAEYLGEATTHRPSFVIHRSFDAPVARVFEMWTDPAQLARWLPPAGTTMRFIRSRIAVGESALFALEGEHGTVHVRADYLAIEPCERIEYVQRFVDEGGRRAAAPGAEVWPEALRNTVLFTEEGPGRTRLTLRTEVEGEASEAELAAFVAERPGMTLGWTGSYDLLEALLEPSAAS